MATELKKLDIPPRYVKYLTKADITTIDALRERVAAGTLEEVSGIGSTAVRTIGSALERHDNASEAGETPPAARAVQAETTVAEIETEAAPEEEAPVEPEAQEEVAEVLIGFDVPPQDDTWENLAMLTTTYMGLPATVRKVRVQIVPNADKIHKSKWYKSMAGEVVDALELRMKHPQKGTPTSFLIYDGDGSATKKFIGGESSLGHLELHGAIVN